MEVLVNERQDVILTLLRQNSTLTLQQLVEATKSSESTIRRDLNDLEKMNKLSRIHGGATVKNTLTLEKSMDENSVEHQQEKKEIAKIAAELIKDGDFIYIDAGSTMLQLISLLKGKEITVVTNGISHLQFLQELGIKTYMIGGELKHSTQAFVGSMAVQALQQYHFDIAFIGVNGFTKNEGFTTVDPEEAMVKKQAISQAEKAYVLADFSKYNHVKFAKIVNLEEVVLITTGLTEEQLATLGQSKMEVLQR